MIPKIIHYCWFGGNPKPKLAEKCIKSWKKYCPDYEIIEWNESNFDISSAPLYVRQAYEEKKWAFVTDYVRLWVVYNYGGIYLDTDVELLKSLKNLLKYHAYFGFESENLISTGPGFGAEKSSQVVYKMIQEYENILFLQEDGKRDSENCPSKNTRVLLEYGLICNNTKQILDGNILILPTEYLCPIDFETNKKKLTKNTISIHWFSASWMSIGELRWVEDMRKEKKAQYKQLKKEQIYKKIRSIFVRSK